MIELPRIVPGMDHGHYAWAPLNETRATLRWPGGKTVALAVIVTLEHLEWKQADGAFMVADIAGGYGKFPHPNVTQWSHREYGHRAGFFRLMAMLERLGITATIAMDAMTAEHYPYLVAWCRERKLEIVAHGISANRMITSRMSEAEERDYIAQTLSSLERAFGMRPRGWLGPELGESARTPALLAEAGVGYLCDWGNDEQPYPFTVPKGALTALPLTLPLDDVNALWHRKMDIEIYARTIREAAVQLAGDGAANARLLAINLRPWLSGQPLRTRYLAGAFAEVIALPGIWSASGSTIIDHYLGALR